MKRVALVSAGMLVLGACQDIASPVSPSELNSPSLPTRDTRIVPIARWVKDLQYTNSSLPSFGAVRIHHTPGYSANDHQYYRVSAYDSNLGMIGLLKTSTSDKLVVAERWIRWYLSHMERSSSPAGVVYDHWYRADGTEETKCLPAGPPCHFVDAADSGAATFLELVREFYQAGGSRKFLTSPSTRDRLRTTGNLVLGLQDTDGLTWAKSDWQVKYLMDNAEVYRGLIAIARLEAELYGNSRNAATYQRAADAVRAGIMRELRDPSSGLFRIAKHSNAVLEDSDLERWYPDTALQAWPLLFGVARADSREATIAWERINSRWNGVVSHNWSTGFVDPVDQSPWTSMGYAAILMGDRARASSHTDFVYSEFRLDGSSPDSYRWPFTVRHAGWILRTISHL